MGELVGCDSVLVDDRAVMLGVADHGVGDDGLGAVENGRERVGLDWCGAEFDAQTRLGIEDVPEESPGAGAVLSGEGFVQWGVFLQLDESMEWRGCGGEG